MHKMLLSIPVTTHASVSLDAIAMVAGKLIDIGLADAAATLEDIGNCCDGDGDAVAAQLAMTLDFGTPTCVNAPADSPVESALEAIALTGSLVVLHDRWRGLCDTDNYAITIKDADGKLLIGTSVHDDEMDATVGPMMAATLRDRVFCGSYVIRFSPLEIMGLRGTLAERIATGDWSHDNEPSAPAADQKRRTSPRPM